MSRVKVFVIYYNKKTPIFKNEVFEPIQAGADVSGVDLGILKDNTGNSISRKNPNYGEMTAWYWVARNWLPKHPEVKYVGFFHYRHLLDLSRPAAAWRNPHGICSYEEFARRFASPAYSELYMLDAIGEADIVTSGMFDCMTFANNFAGTVYDQYVAAHPLADFERALQWYVGCYPELKEKVRTMLAGEKIYTGLNFIMRRECFLAWEAWMLELARYLESAGDWSTYRDYNSIRCPAFIAERFINLWMLVENERRPLRIKEFYRWLLTDDGARMDIPWILSGVKQWLRWKLGLRKHEPLPSSLIMPS